MDTEKNNKEEEKLKEDVTESNLPKAENTLKNKITSGLKTAKKIAIRSVLLLLVVSLSGFIVFANINHSNGTRVGKVVKISRKGVLFKTWEGQLSFGDNKDLWDFSIQSSEDDVRANIDLANEKNKRVRLSYKEKYITFPWRGDTKYQVHNVEILE
jgi:hypothetical protein